MYSNNLKSKILNKKATISVVGLGYVGLPIAISFINAGYKVIGIEKSLQKINLLKSGESYIEDIKNEDIIKINKKDSFILADDYSYLSIADVVIICVPTPVTENQEPDVTYINDVIGELKKYMKKGLLVILESTIYPGGTEELIEKEINQLGYNTGKDFFLCFSPERIDPGNKKFNIKNTPKVISGATEQCLELGHLLYKSIVNKLVCVESIRIAEMSKLIENVYRSINIAFANEMTLLCEHMGITIWEVINAAATKPFGFMPFYPGAGVGGHCIPIDSIYLSWKAKKEGFNSRLIEIAEKINKNMPNYIVNKIIELLDAMHINICNARILLLGITYKKDVNDIRESPALDIYHMLTERGCIVDYSDPYVKCFNSKNNTKIYSREINSNMLSTYDCVVLLTDHSVFDYHQISNYSKLILDTKNVFKKYLKKGNIFRIGDRIDSLIFNKDIRNVALK